MCQRYSKLPSEVMQEDAYTMFTMARIAALYEGSEPEAVDVG